MQAYWSVSLAELLASPAVVAEGLSHQESALRLQSDWPSTHGPNSHGPSSLAGPSRSDASVASVMELLTLQANGPMAEVAKGWFKRRSGNP